MSEISGVERALIAKRDELQFALERSLSAAVRAGRENNYTPGEIRGFDELRDLNDRINDIAEDRERRGDLTNFSARINNTGGQTNGKHVNEINDSALTYRKGDNSVSWLRDMVRVAAGLDHGDERRRLNQHAQDVATHPAFMEHRDLSRVDGSGGFASAPAWLLNQYVELARPGRAFANLIQREPLPISDSINIPKLLTGTAVGIQTADNTAIVDVDATDTFINAPVRTIAGQEGISIQLIDQSPLDFTEIIFRDLVAAHAAATDTQVLYGTGTSGQVLGLDNTPGITTIAVSSVNIAGIYAALAQAISIINTTRFLPAEVIVMHPRRWGAILAELDDQGRPLVVPLAAGNQAFNATGILTDVSSQQVVGSLLGLPVVTDPNITITAGNETPTGSEDVVIVARVSDGIIFESGIRARVLPEVKASSLTVICQVYSYLAATFERFPQSFVQITGLTAPQW